MTPNSHVEPCFEFVGRKRARISEWTLHEKTARGKLSMLQDQRLGLTVEQALELRKTNTDLLEPTVFNASSVARVCLSSIFISKTIFFLKRNLFCEMYFQEMNSKEQCNRRWKRSRGLREKSTWNTPPRVCPRVFEAFSEFQRGKWRNTDFYRKS